MGFISGISLLWNNVINKQGDSVIERAENEFSKTIYSAMKEDGLGKFKDGKAGTAKYTKSGRRENEFLEEHLTRAFTAFEAFINLCDSESESANDGVSEDEGDLLAGSEEEEAKEANIRAQEAAWDYGDCKPENERSESVTTVYYAFDNLLVSADATHVIPNIPPTPPTVIIGDINDDIDAEWDTDVDETT